MKCQNDNCSQGAMPVSSSYKRGELRDMVNMIQRHIKLCILCLGPEDLYNDDASLTAAVHRSLSLTQALGEKCQNLDASTVSSEDDVNSRHSHSQVSNYGHSKLNFMLACMGNVPSWM